MLILLLETNSLQIPLILYLQDNIHKCKVTISLILNRMGNTHAFQLKMQQIITVEKV